MSPFGRTMTSARRSGKSFVDRAGVWLGLLFYVAWAGGTGLAATTEWVVTNSRTGLAIDGFDPVSYFIDGAATPGRPDFEFRYRDVIWRFCNSGNRAAFADHPGDYEPRFGGYDPIALARGAPTAGNPDIWLIWEQKLYLFFDTRTRDEFAADPRRAIVQADARWPDILRHVLSQ